MKLPRILTYSILASFILTACSLKTKPSSKVESASFRVNKVKGDAVDSMVFKDWSLPKQKLFNFTACVEDLSGQSQIVGHPFKILADGREYQTVSDSDQCVHWSEEIEFDALASPTYIKISRRIQSLGKQRGTVTFDIAINPWSGLPSSSQNAVVDLNRESVTKLAPESAGKSALSGSAANAAHIQIDSVNLRTNLTEGEKNNYNAQLVLSFKPKLLTKDMSGNDASIPLMRSSFLVKPYIVRIDNKRGEKEQRTILHLDAKAETIQLDAGQASKSFNLQFSETLDPQKQYALLLEVKAVDAPNYIAPFLGEFDIGSFTSLQSGQAVYLRDLVLSNEVENYFRTVTNREIKPGLTPQAKEGVVVLGTASATSNGVRFDVDGYAHQLYAMTVPVLSLFHAPVPGRSFNVYSMIDSADKNARGKLLTPQSIQVTPEGTLAWNDVVSYKALSTQKRFKKYYIIEDVLTGETMQKCAFVNPQSIFATFLSDCDANQNLQDLLDVNVSHLSNIAKNPTVKFDSVSFTRGRINYRVLDDLSLEIKNNYDVALSASITRFDDLVFGANASSQSLLPGWWLMTVTMYRYNEDLKEIGRVTKSGDILPITTFQKPVCSLGGQLNTQMELILSDTGLMTEQNVFAINLQPIDYSQIKWDEAPNPNEPGCGGKIATDSPLVIVGNTDLKSPNYVFQWTPSKSDSAVTLLADNIEDPVLKNFARSMESTDLQAVHTASVTRQKEYERKLKAEINPEKGWILSAQKMKLKPYLLDDRSFLNDLADKWNQTSPNREQTSISSAQLKKTLECLDLNLWADKTQQPHCAVDPEVQMVAQRLCLYITNTPGICTNGGTWDPAAIGPDENYIESNNFFHQLSAEKRIHVYHLLQPPAGQSPFIRGYASSLDLATSFDTGQFNGTDFGYLKSDDLMLALNLEVAASANLADGKIAKRPVAVGAGAGAVGTIAKSIGSFNINFTRDWIDNMISQIQGTSLNVENAEISLSYDRSRTCYAVRFGNDSEKGLYICAPISDVATTTREFYFSIINTHTSNNIMIRDTDARNRWKLQFRGNRIFYHFMAQITENLAPFHRSRVSVGATELVSRIRDDDSLCPNLSGFFNKRNSPYDRLEWGEPYVLTSPSPGNPHDPNIFMQIPGTVKDLPLALAPNPLQFYYGEQKMDTMEDLNRGISDFVKPNLGGRCPNPNGN